MAYYNSSYSGSDYGEYNFNSYSVNYDYDYDQVSSLMTYNSYDYNQPNHGYDSSSYFSHPSYSDHSYNNHQNIAYSTTSFSDPKYLVYDPNYGMTQLVLSYSTLEFNEPAFDEYDPTPYGGGYDIVETYGKPQPPSDKICYPKVVRVPNPTPIPTPTPIPVLAPNPTPIPVPVLVPVPLEDAKIEEKIIKPHNETIDQIAVEKPKSEDSTIKETNEAYEGEEESEDSDYSEENDAEDDDDDNDSGSSYDKEVTPPQYYPSGYGLETLDICESLFGHWPCLAKMKRENCCNGSIHRENHCQENMWNGTADYLFGSPYPYGGRRDDDYGGEFVYGYERH